MLSKILSLILLTGCTAMAATYPQPPKVEREFRAGWVPSVGNIQWPSKRGLPVDAQQKELITILNRAEELKMNAIILQIRPACDALYASTLEPWSEYLTGEMGKPPEPFYDPLAFAVSEAHKRGLELHAWINPYRARVLSSKSPISADHVSKKYPGMVLNYGKYLWLDPGQKAVQDYTLAVISDIVRRYDIDGLHMDDYFYPYIERDADKKAIPFPDSATFAKYQAAGGKLTLGDWRRQNVDTLVARTYSSIKAQKPWVKFGVAPFGIWKPGHPPTTSMKSGNMYEEIYCDSLKWWTNGWMDYLSPQLYWPINPPDQSFTALNSWWAQHNTKQRHLWPGMNTAKVGATNWPATEILNQIKATRSTPLGDGHVHWSMKSVMQNTAGIADQLKTLYAEPALIPASPWLSRAVPAKPTISAQKRGTNLVVHWKSTREQPAAWVMQYQVGTGWRTKLLPGSQATATISPGEGRLGTIAVSAVNRYGNQSSPAFLSIK